MSEEDHEEIEFNSKLEADTIYEWIKNYHTSNPIPYGDVQHKYLNPKLRSYQERAVTWMLAMEKNENRTARIVNDGDKLVRFEKGGILADEMGLGKTVEVLACILAHPNPDYKKQLEEYIEKMKEDLLKYETGDLRNEDENRENYEENNSREKSKRKTVKNNDIEEVEDDVSIKSSCKLKQKNVYSEILDCTLFENEEKLCENGDKLCEIKDKLRENEEKLCEIQDKLRENMDKVCENEVKLRENEDKLCENDEKLCEIKDKLRGNEDKLRENEEKLCENEDKLREIKDKLRENEDKLCENVYNLREDGYEKLGVSESEKMLREVEESELDEIDKKDNKEFKGVVKNKVRRGTEDKVGLGESVKMETEENKIDAGDTKDLDETMLTNNELEKSEIGSNIEVISRRRARKAVSPKKRKTQRKKNTISDDEDLDFGSPRRVRRKKNNIEDDEFVCRSASVPDSCSRRSARTKRKLVDDDWFFDDVDDPTTQPSGKLDGGANVSSAVPRRRRAIKSSKSFDADYEPTPTPIKRAKSTKGALMRSELQKMYEALLSETSPAVKKAKIALLKKESDYRCCCLDPSQYISAVTVQCPVCRKLQHRDCVDADASSAVPYVCFTCWPQRALVPSTATLIVAPAAIAGQWSDEIEKHLAPDSNLRVLVYEGVRGGHGYKQPLQLAQYDIVVTTYQVLLKEIDYVSEETDSGPRARRYARKFFAPTSPLTCVEWWRICLDEAQMVERASCKNYSMVSALPAVNRWAVSGTPVQRHVVDLFGLLAFLKVDPYGRYNKTAWSTLERNWRALEELLPQVMWRTSKCDVLTELNVPPQTTIAHWLTFAPVETFFYRKQHALCAALFKQKAQQLLAGQPLTTALRQVSGKQLTALMAPLLRLRQACLHPQLVRGQFVAIKHTLLTMVELLEQMVAKATVDAEEAMRMLVASLNGLAGARLLTGESVEAVNMYRRVLHLAQEYEGRLKMDTLQKIHTMFNLASVLESDGGSAAPPTLRDATLLDDVKAMETDYLNRRLGDVAGNKCALQALADKLPGGCNMLLRCDWWSDMLRHMDTQQLVHKIQVEFEHSKGPLKTLLKKMSGVMALMHELSEWQKSIVETRQSVIDQIKQLEEIPTAVMAGHAVNCHLRNKKPANVDRRCLICRIEHELKQYESLIFWIMNKEDSKSKSKEKQSEEEKQLAAQSSGVDAKQQSAVGLENLENNTIFEVYNVGTWKPSQHEQIIRLIYNSCSKRMMKREWTEESQAQFSALDTLRKEFRRLRLLWSQISDHVAASDELAMCKLRLRLVTTDEYFANQQATAAAAEAAGSSRRKRKPQPKVNENEKRNVICPLMLDTVLHQLQAEVAVNESALRKAAGTLQYLHNLQKNGDKQTEPCPVCHCQLTDSWSVLKCGHCYCYDCIHTLTGGFSRESIKCAVCRENTLTLDVSHIEARHTTVAHAQIKGSFTTKIEAMVGELLALRAKEPDVKVLIFSVWDGVLNVLAEALELNEIEYCRLSSGSNSRQQSALTRFKRESRVCVLLMPLRLGARGLNLTQATHVFLAEPCLNPADLLQAVGRVHRIGQTRETFVHKFAVRGTIEEKMVTAMEGSDSKWAKDKVTVQQLLDLFVPVDNNKH